MKEQSQQHCERVAETAGVDCVTAHGVIERESCAKIRVNKLERVWHWQDERNSEELHRFNQSDFQHRKWMDLNCCVIPAH